MNLGRRKECLMKKLLHWSAAAALAVSGFAFVPSARAADPVEKTKDTAHNVKTNWENGRVYTMLGQVTNAALTKGGFNDVVERFNDADRNRIGSWGKDKNNKEKLDVLDGRIAQFQKDWKA